MSFPAESKVCENTVTKSKRIKIYPNKEQRIHLKRWFAASRKSYNETVQYLKQKDTKANWITIKLWLLKTVPDWCKNTPFQVKAIAIKDACTAVKNAKIKFRKTGDENEVKFRSIKAPVQSIYIPKSAIKENSIYVNILGKLDFMEPLPENVMDSRLLYQNGNYYLCVSHTVKTTQQNSQARVVSLDPGIRTFQTFFSETSCGKIGKYSIGRIQRLCSYLDDLISRISKQKGSRKARMRRAANRMRIKIRNLISEIHWKTARFLCTNFDVIILPTFETSQMVLKGKRKLRSKSVRQMLTYSHFLFKQRIKHKANELGKLVIDSCEAYTSKTASWTGEMKKIGGAKTITSNGITLDRDINGARGIFLRALVDTPTREILLQNVCVS
jgi:putative transposase